MLIRTFFRMVWMVTAFLVAAATALTVLLVVGGTWMGDELRAAAPEDPLLEHGAPAFGIVLFAGTVGPALTALPGLIAVAVGEALKLRSWMYYVLKAGRRLQSSPSSQRRPRRSSAQWSAARR